MIDIYNDDSINVLSNINDNSIDLIVTDPPYKVISGGSVPHEDWESGYSKSVLKNNDGKIFKHNDIDHQKWLNECYRVLKEDSHIYIMTNVLNLFELKEMAEKAGFKLHNLLVWEKNSANANRWYMKNCEYTLFMRKGKAKTINDAGSKTVHKFNNIIGNKVHPTEKPVDLMELYVTNSSNEGDIVMDPFMGAGSTGIAAIKNNRHFVGVELDSEYYEIAKNRLESFDLTKGDEVNE